MKLGQIDNVTTANIGKFHGGAATNIVADEVVLEAARSHSDTMIKQQIHHMKETFESTAKALGGAAEVNVVKVILVLKFPTTHLSLKLL